MIFLPSCVKKLLSKIYPLFKSKISTGTLNVILILVCLSLFAIYGIRPHIKIKIEAPEIKQPEYNFFYENLAEDKLKKLRSKYKLTELVGSGENEFEKQIILAQWIRKQKLFQRKNENFDIFDLMKPEKNRPNASCSDISAAYVQTCLSMGYQARVVSIAEHENKGHWTAEVFSNIYDKWVIIDPYLGYYFTDGTAPLNALEIHNLYKKNRANEINAIRFDQLDVVSDPLSWRYFKHLAVFMNNAFISFCRQTGKDIIWLKPLVWEDEITQGLEVFKNCPKTKNASEFNFKINQCGISISKKWHKSGKVDIILKTNTPQFSHYIISDETNNIKITQKENVYSWKLQYGNNHLKVRASNLSGVEGQESSITAIYYPLSFYGISIFPHNF